MAKILIIEDNETFRQTLCNMLKSRFPSTSLYEAGDGNEAFEKIETVNPDLIFVDIKLPGDNGLEITRKIRSSNRNVRIVVITSHDLPEYREAANVYGANHFLSKGTSSSEEILHLVENILNNGAH